MRSSQALCAVGIALFALSACGSDDPQNSFGAGGAGAGAGTGGAGGGEAPPLECSQPTPVPCEDEVIIGMNLQSGEAAPGAVSSEADGAGFRSFIDATAGGFGAAEVHSYVYARFTDSGLEKVAISDEESLASMDWDIAFRRYVLRINSGNSGPSCVQAARLVGTPDYEGITALPEELKFRTDTYFTEDSCELLPDTSGLMGAPGTVLSGYWSYPGCIAMTGNVYILALADGRTLKLTVTHYYKPEAQEQCQETGMAPMVDSGSANFQIRWAFLQ